MNKNQPTIAITGANGFLGTTLVQHFAKQGWQVVGLVRNPAAHKNTAAVTYRAYDITKPISDDMVKDVTYVVHTAYVKYGRQHPNAMDINIEGAKALLKACKQQDVKKALFMSTMSAHSEATSIYGKQKLTIEQLFISAGGVTLRSGLILGNGGIVRDMAKFMKTKHAVPVIDGGKQPLQTIAVYDLARVIEAALTKNIRGILTVATPRIYSYKEFYQVLARHIHAKVLFVPVPYFVLLTAFNAAALLHVPLDLGADNLRGLKQLRSADTASDLNKLGLEIDDLDTALNTLAIVS
jgi:nucleoside-diphosphate-sugar epimerase